MYRICVVTAKIAFCFPVFVRALKPNVIKDKNYKIIIFILSSLVIIYTDGQSLKQLTEITGKFKRKRLRNAGNRYLGSKKRIVAWHAMA